MEAADAPFVRWFVDGMTNSAFNEIDCHVLANRGDEVALVCEPDVEVLSFHTTRRTLLIQSVLASHALRNELHLEHGQRIAFYLPNDAQTIIWIEAARRLGAPYTAVALGVSVTSLVDRIIDTGAAILVSNCDLDAEVPEHMKLVVTVDGRTESRSSTSRPACRESYDGSGLLDRANGRLLHEAGGSEGEGATDVRHVSTLWKLVAPLPVEASHPLFVLYTSGSTGKPKGVVHTHGGYPLGLVITSELVFDLRPERADVLFVAATAGWITGQSYMIAAALLCRVPSVAVPCLVAVVAGAHQGVWRHSRDLFATDAAMQPRFHAQSLHKRKQTGVALVPPSVL